MIEETASNVVILDWARPIFNRCSFFGISTLLGERIEGLIVTLAHEVKRKIIINGIIFFIISPLFDPEVFHTGNYTKITQQCGCFPSENEYQCCGRGVLTLKNILLSVR
jgi:hypothetical protein